MMRLPESLAQTIRSVHGERGEAWVQAFPELLKSCEEKWLLRIDEQEQERDLFPLSFNYVAPVRFEDGRQAVLKLGVPSKEIRTEAAALQWFGGEGAVRVIEADPEEGILLLERIEPGETLHTVRDEEEAVKAAAKVMRKLWKPAPEELALFPSVNDWFKGYGRLRGRFGGGTGPLPETLVQRAEERLASLRENPTEHFLLHGDLHHGNLLSATRERWLAIDPKGVIGEAEYEPCAFLMNGVNETDPVSQIRLRVACFSRELGLDPRRILFWAFCHAILSAWWCIEDGVGSAEGQIRLARYLDDVISN